LTEVRELGTPDDLAAWIDVHNRVGPVPYTAEEVASFREALAGAETHLLALRDGEAAGVGWVAIEDGAGDSWIGVLPGSRGQGIGSGLYAALSAWARARGLERLESRVDGAETEGLAWAARRGFVETGRETRLALDLAALELPDALGPDAPGPEGLEIVTWADRPELARGMYAVALEAYPDIPGADAEQLDSFEDWLALHMGGSGDRPEAVFVALVDGEVVGYSKLHLWQARPTVAGNDITGVLRAWRGRGVAGALKHAQLAWAKENGYERLETANELRNEPIRRLNERLGYRPFAERVLLRGPLAPAP
jgi:GNAT superfamily N-acetyltransferase